MLDLCFRPFRSTDAESVQQLVDGLLNAYSAEKLVKPNIVRTFAEFTRYPDKGQIVVIEYNQQVVGYAILIFVWTNELGNYVLWIDELAVHEKYRSLGIGKRFFSWLQSTYHSSPAYSLLVSENNFRARKFYEEIGFNPLQLQMLKVNHIAEQSLPIIEEKELIGAV